jgi:lipopolysaccharide/colanic/teichoic acid biosynthesis glycosyltransferase
MRISGVSPPPLCNWIITYSMIKRSIDLMVSLVAIIILSPVILALVTLVWLKIGCPVFFRQKRPGKGSEPFDIIKFRTMSDQVDQNGKLLPDAARLSSFGAILRSTSLDELPALWNVLLGNMSLVGPRPLLMQYLPRYTSEQMRRHEVRPGITGWAQVNGRNAISWEEKFALDVWYVDNQSLILDLKIIFLTIAAVLARKNISATGEATMPEFMGSEAETR